ncbi:MAG: ParB/RepB/Spo0J family partition protein [Lachnospiraceae bacterium]|nr:ParB/RepB/Spo0J family partition protein [Lachnospiraceae bacterium]
MSKHGFKDNVTFAGYNDIFKTEDDYLEISDEQVVEIRLNQLFEFKNHPFRVVNDEKMKEMIESIKQYGVLMPGIVRERAEGGYEIIAGHRRKLASEMAGKETMPVIIRDITDDEATIIMVDSNIQREDILPSEKAKSYRMKYEAMKHQGQSGGKSLEIMGEQSGEAGKTIQRYIWLSNLNDTLLTMVDNKKLGIAQGTDISFLGQEEQNWVVDEINVSNCKISNKQAKKIKDWYKQEILTRELLHNILDIEKIVERKVTLSAKKLNDFFEPYMSNEEIEDVIVGLLKKWKTDGGDK